MSLGLIVAVLVATAGVLLILRRGAPCNHRMYYHYDEATSRMHLACRCGERTQP